MSGSVGASDDKRGSTKGGSLLLAEIDQHRLFGRYASLRAASHTLPSSSVAQAQSLRNLILGECELEQYVLQEQEQAALRSAIAQSGSPDQDQASSSHVHLLVQDESTPDGQRRSVSRKHSRSSSMSGSGSASSAKEKHCLQVAGRYFKDVIATNKNENDLLARSSRALENADIFVRLYDCIMLLLNICGLHDQAVEVLERAIAATYGADNFHLWMLLGAELERTDRHKHAIAVYHQCALDHTTTHPARVCEALTAAAKASLFLGTQRASQDAIQADLRKARTASTTQQQRHATDQLAAATHLLEYRSLHDAAQQAAALKAAKTALSSIDDDLKTADDMYLEALTLAHARATDDAVGAVWSCLSLCPTHRQGLQLFALLLTAKRNLDEALSVCHQTLELFPTDVVSMRIAGHTTHALEGPRGALSAYKTFFASMNTMMRDAMKAGRPFQPLGPSSIGADTLTGRVRDAIEHLEQALTFDEHDVTSLVELGMCQHSLGEADMAENRLQHALRIDPTHAEAHRALATLLQERGATDDAVQCMLHALQLGAHQPILPYHTLTCCPFLT
ncbi:hypothetical protein PTSG_13035 [Salpingoeca rosetta]|uniref:Uncharacterized protein n=1 Tax=Salpingoeca rosetta (strain ATCC 50818 / BSB-021) TaxID=946362 RepID=F2UR53_SALR5|nr:uncharacterized protein PTSG_13035 [Salpingoeca rosetta]EGD80108.1 hypothetical protein PTSG_13035 [Salpingoeca rosetta]|eukprot:XP_004988433.1 hypothetical protein PTSG_13035 [Salpingoeca rosetta]